MADYLHGAYGEIQSVGNRVADDSVSAIVYVGTAPVHQLASPAGSVNKPILVHDIAEAKKYFGYSEDYAKYTLCEAMHVHLEHKGIGPLVFINVLDPTQHKDSTSKSRQATPANGQIVMADAEAVILSTLTVGDKVKGTDYTAVYDPAKKSVFIRETSAGSLGSAALTLGWYEIDTTKVTNAAVIGSEGNGYSSGLHAVKQVYQRTGHIPAYLLCPGFSCVPAIHEAMIAVASKINGHWDAYCFADLPITVDSNPMELAEAKAWKDENGYTHPNETVFYPMAAGVDGRKYHLSVLAAANFQALLFAQDGIPYKTASNTAADLIQNLWIGATAADCVWDDQTVNETLNKNGIASAAFVGGRWAIWGCHSADYDQSNADMMNVSETTRMMLFYISNDFQYRRAGNVDKPMTRNDLTSIVAEEQTRLDALLSIGALTYGRVYVNADADARSDVMNGDYSFVFDVSTTPLAKSLTAIVNWTDQGFVTFYENMIAFAESTVNASGN